MDSQSTSSNINLMSVRDIWARSATTIPSVRADHNSLAASSTAKYNAIVADHMRTCFLAGTDTDFVIKCKSGREMQVHKVMLSRSKVFDRICNNKNFREGNEGSVSLDAEDIAVEAVVRYLYGFQYASNSRESQLQDVHIYAAAEKYQLCDLKEEAKASFKKALECTSTGNAASFAAVAEVVFTSTREDDRGLRDLILSAAIRLRKDLVNSEDGRNQMTELFRACPELAWDLYHSRAKESKKSDAATVVFRCILCNSTFLLHEVPAAADLNVVQCRRHGCRGWQVRE